ncbi:hypothetical protein PSTT_02243 [Puccinia striiformis]|uniref:Globin-sensor domain-containing protein n=1 Tax=Puccinia striiformis TaxID=27350 RepID=A0A2S4W0R3_9BASI|nr:hypothetical protein PSTT_02243 [Puccinia striiformis]
MDPETVTRADLNFDLASRVRYMKSFLDFTEEDSQIMHEVRPIAKPLVPEIVASAYTKLLSYDACRMAFFPRKDGAQGTHGTAEDLVHGNDPLSLNSATIKLRRNILERWAMKIFTGDYDRLEARFLSFSIKSASSTPVGHEFSVLERISRYTLIVSKTFQARERRSLRRVTYGSLTSFDPRYSSCHGGQSYTNTSRSTPLSELSLIPLFVRLRQTLGYITSKMTSAILTLPSSTWPAEKKTRAVVAFHKISTIHNDLIARHHIGDLCSPPTSRAPSPDQEISPQNRKEYYNNVFMVGSPTAFNTMQVPSPPRDAPFQSLVSITPQSSNSSRPYVTQPGDFSQITSVQRTRASTSDSFNPHKSISSFGDAPNYFPGSHEETQMLNRTPSKGNLNRRKFSTRIKKSQPP